VVFRSLVAPRLGPVREREPEAPLRFAQFVGLLFAVVGTAGYLLGAPTLGAVATGFALVAALLNAAAGFCLGCEMYLLVRRALPART
jgi:zinc transporter ZupT